MWSDFNTANRNAMMKSEVISWPVTLGILLLAFGSLVAAGLPLMLTMIGLASAAGLLFLGTKLMPISIWAMNFALMFALALGIDYALFVVHRFRGALFGHKLNPVDATAVTMDTAGKAVLFSGVTVLISLSAVMLVPSPAFRSMSLGIMLAVIFVLAATLTLLPAVLARIGPKVDKLALPWAHSGEHRSARFAAWGDRLWNKPRPLRRRRRRDPRRARAPGHATEDRDAIDQGRPHGRRVLHRLPPGPARIRARLDRPAPDRGPGRERHRSRTDREARPGDRGADADPDIGGYTLLTAIPKTGPLKPGGRSDDRPAPSKPARRVADRRRGRGEPRPPGRPRRPRHPW